MTDVALIPTELSAIAGSACRAEAHIMEAAALYEPPFSNLHSGGPDALFAGKDALLGACRT